MPLKIYYLDDEADLCESFAELYSGPEMAIETFSSPEDLIRRCEAARPDLVLLDFRLPGTTGDIVAGRLDPTVPKILVTGDIDAHTKFRFLTVLEKPIRADAFLAALKLLR